MIAIFLIIKMQHKAIDIKFTNVNFSVLLSIFFSFKRRNNFS